MTLVVLCLHNYNMFMVLLIFALGNIKIGATKPIFLDSGSPIARGRWGGSCVRGHAHGLLSFTVIYVPGDRRSFEIRLQPISVRQSK